MVKRIFKYTAAPAIIGIPKTRILRVGVIIKAS